VLVIINSLTPKCDSYGNKQCFFLNINISIFLYENNILLTFGLFLSIRLNLSMSQTKSHVAKNLLVIKIVFKKLDIWLKTLWKTHSDCLPPVRVMVGMTQHFMQSYSDLLIRMCHMCNVHVMRRMRNVM